MQKQVNSPATQRLPMSNQCKLQAPFFPARLKEPSNNMEIKINKMVFIRV